MLRSALARCFDDRQKRVLKAKVHQARLRVVKALRSYGPAQLTKELRRLGVAESDTLFVHSNFEPLSGFTGTPADVVRALASAVPDGTLLMTTIPFRGSAYDYLRKGKVFDVRKTMSMMGLITENFRRHPGTVRSLHPTHPVVALGRDAEWVVEGHDVCAYPCGPGTPFEKLRTLHGKILFFDVGFGAITFFHYVEHLLMPQLPFPIYEDEVFEMPVVDGAGTKRTVRTHAYSRAFPRNAASLYAEMLRRRRVTKGRVGNSRLLLVQTEDVVDCMTDMVKQGRYPYHLQATT